MKRAVGTSGDRLGRRALLRGDWRSAGSSLIRPPGAVEAERFEALCDGCGECAAVCPVAAIAMLGPATRSARATPIVVAAEAPCVMCDGLPCSGACPPRALQPVTPQTMHIAEVTLDAKACWAWQGIDPDCDYCFDRCPRQGKAITYQRGQGPIVKPEHCTGCGVCAHFCPAQPAVFTLKAV